MTSRSPLVQKPTTEWWSGWTAVNVVCSSAVLGMGWLQDRPHSESESIVRETPLNSAVGTTNASLHLSGAPLSMSGKVVGQPAAIDCDQAWEKLQSSHRNTHERVLPLTDEAILVTYSEDGYGNQDVSFLVTRL